MMSDHQHRWKAVIFDGYGLGHVCEVEGCKAQVLDDN